MTWDAENPVSHPHARSAAAREGARSIREVLGARDLGGDQRALPLVRERGRRRAVRCSDRDEFYRHVRRVDAARASGLRAQHDAARRAAGLPLAGRAARARRPDGAHRSTCTTTSTAPPSAQHQIAAADRALAVAAARLLRLRGVHAPRAGPRQPRGRRVVPAVRGALPALAALLRPVGAGAVPPPRRQPGRQGRGDGGAHPAGRARSLAGHPGSQGHPADGPRPSDPRRRRGERRLPGAASRASRARPPSPPGLRSRKPPSKKPVSSTGVRAQTIFLLEKRRKQSPPYPVMVWRLRRPSASRFMAPAIGRWTASSG